MACLGESRNPCDLANSNNGNEINLEGGVNVKAPRRVLVVVHEVACTPSWLAGSLASFKDTDWHDNS